MSQQPENTRGRHRNAQIRNCQVCGKPVRIADPIRYRQVVEEGIPVRCEQCRGYVSTGSAREPEASAPASICDLGLAPKRRRNAKRRRSIASMPLRRCVPKGIEESGG